MSWYNNKGGANVGPGSYWDLHDGKHVHLGSAGILPGDVHSTYYRLPPLVMLVLAPVFGLLYALFLPFAGIAMLIAVLLRITVDGVGHALRFAGGLERRPRAGSHDGNNSSNGDAGPL